MTIVDVINKHLKDVYYKSAYGIECESLNSEEVTLLFMSLYSCDTVDLTGTIFDVIDAGTPCTATVTSCNPSISFVSTSTSCDPQITLL